VWEACYKAGMTRGKLQLPSFAKGLSARLLVLTIAFVMLAEVLIYTPSIGRFRLVWLEERLAAAHLAILALEATPDQMVSESLQMELLSHAGASMIGLKKPNMGKLMLMAKMPGEVEASYDLQSATAYSLIRDAFATLFSDGNRTLRIIGRSPKDPEVTVEVLLGERPLREAMLAFSQRILALSLVISLITAALVYLSLHWLMVRPMRRITESMIAFRENPEDALHAMTPTNRNDEIGLVQRELASMQEGVRTTLRQKTRLAALGIAVTKINHDLRNILASARLISDRLVESDDPEVRRVTPTLVTTIDRAVDLCAQTLNFTRDKPPKLEVAPFSLGELIEDVEATLRPSLDSAERFQNQITNGLKIEGDRQQLFRVFSNLGRNALDAGAGHVTFKAHENGLAVVIDVADDGPGLPPRAREKLFQPFESAGRSGGTGLGLCIARDLVRAHGGDIRLAYSHAGGTCFRIELPKSSA
jgi:signal transduction histidine kinase